MIQRDIVGARRGHKPGVLYLFIETYRLIAGRYGDLVHWQSRNTLGPFGRDPGCWFLSEGNPACWPFPQVGL
jgi:hypothetical protein